MLRKAHQTLRRVTQDFETRWHFNSAIAQIMGLVNAIYAAEPLDDGVRPAVQKEVLELVTLMLAPMTPHLAEELWEMLGHKDGLWTVGWPAINEDLAKEDEVEIPVQVNGKVRGRVTVPTGRWQDEGRKRAARDAGVEGEMIACYRRRNRSIVTLSGFHSSCSNSLMSKPLPAPAAPRRWNTRAVSPFASDSPAWLTGNA